MNPDQKENLQNQVDEWLEEGVIKPSVSPWAWPLVLLKKKEGGMRWVTDLREMNKQTDSEGQLPPHEHTGDLTQSTRCYGVFVFGCLWSYHAGRIEPRSGAGTSSSFNTFQYILMPFGLANAGSVHSRMLDVAMKEVDSYFWPSYLDDILT